MPIDLWDNQKSFTKSNRFPMNLQTIILLSFMQCLIVGLHAQVACTATSCPLALPEENIDSIRVEMGKQIKLIADKFIKADLKIVIINVADKRYGYQIISDGNMLIEEKSIPAIAGYIGFINEEEARRVAEFALQRIKAGEMPPSISIEDLKRLQITME